MSFTVPQKPSAPSSSGGSMLGPGGTGPQILPRPPIFYWFYSNSLSRCCLPNDEGPAPYFS